MGYQESYMRMSNSKDFDKLIKTIQDNGEKAFDLTTPVEIITLLKPIMGTLDFQCRPDVEYTFKPGERFIYIVGERSGQRNAFSFFGYCENVSKDILDNLEIYFTECFPSDDIFENNDTTKMATHEKFVW